MNAEDKIRIGLICAKGGSGGGGGGSGAIDYPDYMEAWHSMALDDSGADTLTSSLTDVMDAAIGNSPWATATVYNPDADLALMIAAPDELQNLVTLLSNGTTLDTLIADILDHTRVDDAVTEYSADLGARLTAEVLPRFESGMRDINAVVSSAFVIGRAIIEDGQTRQVAKYSADLHMRAFSNDALQVIGMKLQYQQVASSMIIEANRMKIVAKKEETEGNNQIEEQDALWDIEVFQYGGNLLAGIGGGTVNPKEDVTRSKFGSAIGGAMSGAVAGAMYGATEGALVGSVPGALIGGILGAASSLF